MILVLTAIAALLALATLANLACVGWIMKIHAILLAAPPRLTEELSRRLARMTPEELGVFLATFDTLKQQSERQRPVPPGGRVRMATGKVN